MSLEFTIPIPIWSFVRWLPKWWLRKKFPDSRMAQLMYIDLRPRHDSVTLTCKQNSNVILWVQVINLSPFAVTLNATDLTFQCGQRWKTPVPLKHEIQPGQVYTILIEQDIQVDPLTDVQKISADRNCSLNGIMQFSCPLHDFSKNITLDGISARCVNC